MRATFIDAGHILGSASIALQLTEKSQQSTVLFSGDLGKSHGPLLRGPEEPPNAANVVIETTYGDRLHKPLGPSIEEFYDAMKIPSRAAEMSSSPPSRWNEHRSCSISSARASAMAVAGIDGGLPRLANGDLGYRNFGRHLEYFQPAIEKLVREDHDRFICQDCISRARGGVVALNNVHAGAIIMAGSGMCTGGRVRHHLQHNLRGHRVGHCVRWICG